MKLLKTIKKIGSKTLDLVLPAICPVTGETVDEPGMIHPPYWLNLNFIKGQICPVCGTPISNSANDAKNDEMNAGYKLTCAHCLSYPPSYDQHRSPSCYDDASKPLILKFKHSDQHHLTKSFQPWLCNSLLEFSQTDFDIIIPVPLHYKRLLKRRYNQAALLAKTVSKANGIAWSASILKRVKNTETQGRKNARARLSNVKGAFVVKDKYLDQIKNKHILLIDDVYTTGATVNSCAKAMNKAGAARVSVLTVARVVKE